MRCLTLMRRIFGATKSVAIGVCEVIIPIFAVARIVGWSAHRMEELINTDKIIRPAYKNVLAPAVYVPLKERE